MTNTPDTSSEAWWDHSLTSAGRRDILKAAGLRLPSAVQWRHLSPEARVAVAPMQQLEDAPALSHEDPITQLRIENSLLRGQLWLTARRLKDYHDAPHVKTDDEQLQVTIPASLRESAAEALAKTQAMLKDEGRER